MRIIDCFLIINLHKENTRIYALIILSHQNLKLEEVLKLFYEIYTLYIHHDMKVKPKD